MGSVQTGAKRPRVEAKGAGVTSKDAFSSDSQIFLVISVLNYLLWGHDRWDQPACPLRISQNPLPHPTLHDLSASHSQLGLNMEHWALRPPRPLAARRRLLPIPRLTPAHSLTGHVPP